MRTVGSLKKSHQITKTRYINKRKRQKWKTEKKKRKSHMQNNNKNVIDKLIDQIEEYPVYYSVMAFLTGYILTHLYLTWFVR